MLSPRSRKLDLKYDVFSNEAEFVEPTLDMERLSRKLSNPISSSNGMRSSMSMTPLSIPSGMEYFASRIEPTTLSICHSLITRIGFDSFAADLWTFKVLVVLNSIKDSIQVEHSSVVDASTSNANSNKERRSGGEEFVTFFWTNHDK